ncbi:MAG: NAD(P)/FAD-dependent oxidoreductase [Dehalococcoidia bacterium]
MQPDVIVVGGGPAGSTAATMLARGGYRVTLLERERFPRDHIGESLLPASLPVLDALGVRDAVEQAGFLKKWGATMVWGTNNEPWSWYFRETNKTHPHAYQVWRPKFDQILLENAAANGVDVRQEHRVTDLELGGQGSMAVEFAGPGGVRDGLRARFVVDASGQTGLIGRKLSLRRPDEKFLNLACYGYFANAERLAEPNETNILVESYEHGWFWAIPLHNGWMSVGAVVDHKYGAEGVRSQGAEAFLRAQIEAAPHVSQMLRDAVLMQGPTVLRDWSYLSDEVAGDGWVLSGDAACFIDPLFSTGVHLALSSGVLAAAYVTSALEEPAIREPAGQVYKELYLSQYHLFRQLAGMFYATNRSVESYFWEAKRILGAEDLAPRAAFIRAVAGQPPKGYERMVLERGDAPAGFAEGLQELSAGRRARAEAFEAALARPGQAGTALHDAVLCLAPEAKVERKPVLEGDRFVWGHVLGSPDRPEGTPIAPLIVRLVALLDGRRTVAEAIRDLAGEAGSTPAALTGPVLQVLRTLVVEGSLAGIA